MIAKTKGIVLSYVKYKDTSIIARIFTEEFGYGSFLINSIRSQRSKKSIGYFQPFSLLEMVVYMKDSRDIQRLSEFKCSHPIHCIHQDPMKSTITLFLLEVFSRLLQSEQSPNTHLFQFTENAIKTFDLLEEGVANFHLQFLLKLGPFLGYEISDIEHLYSSIDKVTPDTADHQILTSLIQSPFGLALPIDRTKRNTILDAVISYYMHHAHLPKPKSIDVLRKIIST